jgi:hypothetical protein
MDFHDGSCDDGSDFGKLTCIRIWKTTRRRCAFDRPSTSPRGRRTKKSTVMVKFALLDARERLARLPESSFFELDV